MLLDTAENIHNPLDHVEEILSGNNWSYNRMTDDEIIVRISGQTSTYNLIFIWQEHMGALQFCCQYDMTIHSNNLPTAAMTLLEINNSLWIGHFEITRDVLTPNFRHTCLLRGQSEQTGIDSIHDLVELALAQCERFYHVFDILSQKTLADHQTLSLAIMEHLGES